MNFTQKRKTNERKLHSYKRKESTHKQNEKEVRSVKKKEKINHKKSETNHTEAKTQSTFLRAWKSLCVAMQRWHELHFNCKKKIEENIKNEEKWKMETSEKN